MTVSEIAPKTGMIWLTYSIAIIVVMLITATSVYKWQPRRSSQPFVSLVAWFSISCLLCTVLLLSVDIALISSTTDSALGTKRSWATPEKVAEIEYTMQTTYFVLYGIDALVCLLVIPFAYFWWEEDYNIDEDGNDDLGRPVPSRFMTATKYTVGFVTIIAVFLSVGYILPVVKFNPTSSDSFALGIGKFFTFGIGSCLVGGTLLYSLYTSVGLARLPLDCLRFQKKPFTSEVDNIQEQLDYNRERQHQIRMRSPTQSSNRTHRELERLVHQERSLVWRHRLAQEAGIISYNRCCLPVLEWVSVVLSPVKFIGGVCLLLLSLILWVSMFTTTFDKALNLSCKESCNYLIDLVHSIQPLNSIFVWTSHFFPLDYVLLVIFLLFMFYASVTGISKLGIRFLWVRIFKVQPGRTIPQALLLSTEMLALMILAINYAFVGIIAPHYSLYGSQAVCTASITNPLGCRTQPELVRPCGSVAKDSIMLGRHSQVCTPSVMSSIIHKISSTWPVFGAVTFWTQFLFLVVYILAFTIHFMHGRYRARRDSESTWADNDSMDSEEERILSAGPNRSLQNAQYGATWQNINGRNWSRTLPQDDDSDVPSGAGRQIGRGTINSQEL